MNKRRKIWILLKIVLLFTLMYLNILEEKNQYFDTIYETLKETFGKTSCLFIVYLMLNIISEFIVVKQKRIVFKIRIIFLFILVLLIGNLKFLYDLQELDSANMQKSVFSYFYIKEEIGLFFTMIFYKLYFAVPVDVNIGITGVITFFSLFILFGKIVGNFFRKIARNFSKEKRKERKERKALIRKNKELKKELKKQEEKAKKERARIIEEEKKQEEKLKKKIEKLKEEKAKKKEDSKIEKQLSIEGLELLLKKEKEEEREEKQEIEIKEIGKNQLNFEFKEKEVAKDDISV